MMNPIDQLIACLDGGVLLIKSDHKELPVSLLRVQNEGEASAESDFSILTPTMCAEFVYYEPKTEIIDRRAEMPHNPEPDHAGFVEAFGPEATDWPRRFVEDITGITIHHTLSHSAKDLFDWITRSKAEGGKGYPRGQYHYWIGQEEGAPVSQLLEDTVGCWHDHTGRIQTTLSVGMAGHLGNARPPEAQLWNTVRLCWELVQKYGLSVDDVQGHNDRYGHTVCPGWYADSAATINSGVWRRDFDIALRCCVDGKEWGGY